MSFRQQAKGVTKRRDSKERELPPTAKQQIMDRTWNSSVLAKFLHGLSSNEGWWYRLPKQQKSGNTRIKPNPDAVLPQFGTLFGLTEDAMVLVLLEMGLYLPCKNSSPVVNFTGWDQFAILFELEHLVEAKETRSKEPGSKREERSIFVRLGKTEHHPVKIWRSFLKNKGSLLLLQHR